MTSAIDVGTSIVVANATTQAFFGTNVWNFFTDGWFGRPSPGSGNSWKLSLKELVNGAIGGENLGSGNAYGMSATYAASHGVTGAIQKNLRDNGAKSLATVILAPVAAKMVKRLARKPISDMNKLLRMTGVSQATGVKV